MGLLDVAGLHHVAVAACKDQRYATNRYSMDAAFDWAHVIEQLAVDVAAANKLLPANKQVRPRRPRAPAVRRCAGRGWGRSMRVAFARDEPLLLGRSARVPANSLRIVAC